MDLAATGYVSSDTTCTICTPETFSNSDRTEFCPPYRELF